MSIDIEQKIQVSNISPLADETVLKTFFEFIGPVKDLALKSTGSTDGVQKCTVTFDSAEDAALSLHLTGTEIADRAILILKASINSTTTSSTSSKVTSPKHLGSIEDKESVKSQESLPLAILALDESKIDPRKIHVANIHPRTRVDDLKKFFIACGHIANIKMNEDSNSAIIEFTSDFSVKAAVQLTGHPMLGSQLKISRVNVLDETPMESSSGPAVEKEINGKPKLLQQQPPPLPSEQRRHRSRSRERERRRPSVSPDRRRDDRSRRRRSRSRSHDRDRYHSSRHRPRSRSRDHHYRRRSRSRGDREYRRRSRSRSSRRSYSRNY